MKLSEMNTAEMAKALCILAAPVGNICSDDKLLRSIADAGRAGETMGAKVAELLPKVIPSLLGDHFEDLVTILAALTGKTETAIRKQKGVETIRDIKECFDKDLLDFFKSSASMERMESQA